MRFWPFSRKRRRDSKSKAESTETKMGAKRHANATSLLTGRPASAGHDEQTPRRRLSKRVAPTSDRDGAGRMAGEGTGRAKGSRQGMSEKQAMPGGSVEDITALPITGAHGRNAQWMLAGRLSLEKRPYNVHRQYSTTNQSIPAGIPTLQRPPSLRSKRSAAESNLHLPRRKSSKKRKDDSIREEEIRAMCSPVPTSTRPSSRGSDGLLRRDSKKLRDGLNRRFQRPESNISLPLANSLRSGTPIPVDEHRFRVRNIFSPRPTIRYSGALHEYRPSSAGTSAAESGGQQRPRLSKEIIEESGTIDELADDLDAGGLKALMDRDQRRKDRKRVQDEERARQRLQRKADKQRAEEQQRDAEYVALRQFKSRELASDKQGPLGIEAGPSITTEVPVIPVTTDKYGHVNTGTYLDYSKVPIPPDPYSESAVEPGSPHSGQRTPWEEAQSPYEEPVVNTAQAVRYSQASVTTPTSPNFHERGPSNVSNLSDLRGQSVPELPEVPDKSPKRRQHVQVQEIAGQQAEAPRQTERRGSDLSSGRTSAWAAIFKRGGTAKRASQDRGGPSTSQASFSNTSRESMSRQPPPAHLQQIPITPQTRSGTITPNRTQSRFREDLPELPLPPSHPVIPSPEARIQSPEATESTPRPITAQRGNATPLRIETGFGKLGVKGSFEDPILKRADSPLNPEARDSGLISQSLASVDSEGSWLSGRPSQRTSQQHSAQTPPIPSLPVDVEYPTPERFQVEDIRYGPLYAPRSQIIGLPQHESEAVSFGSETGSEMEQSPVETQHDLPEHTTVHGGVSRTPTVVRREAHLKSKEGLVNDVQAEEESQYSSSPHEEVAEKTFSNDERALEPSDEPLGQPLEQSSEQWSEISRDQSLVELSDHSSEQSPVQGPVELKRAQSFDYGTHHVRAMSAGSAKLLDIPARTGSTSKRSSPTTPDFREGLSKQRSAAISEPLSKLEGQAADSTV